MPILHTMLCIFRTFTSRKLNTFNTRSSLVLVVVFSLLLTAINISAQEDYQIPDVNDADADQVIATVGDVDLTLSDFFKRVRYDRLLFYRFLNNQVADAGVEILDLENEENTMGRNIIGLLQQLSNERQMGQRAYDRLVLDWLYHQEAEARGIEPSECEVNQIWVDQLLLPPMTECELPEDFESLRSELVDRVVTYTGMSEEELTQMIQFQAETVAVSEAISSEIEIEPETVIRTRHIRVNDIETANEIIERLDAGDSFDDLLNEYTIDAGVLGSGGDLGEFQRGMMVPEFEEAAFNAEVGEIVGPIETQFGFHIIEVLDNTLAEQAHVRKLVLATQEEADAALRLLNNGRDFGELAREYSIDPFTAANGGDLGFVERGVLPEEIEDEVFSAESGTIIGPVETSSGWEVDEVLEVREAPVSIHARHILVETEEEAQAVLDRLQNGEDFADLARELSIDPSAKPLGADTMTIATGGQQSGFYGRGELLPEFDAVFEAEVGDIVGPIETSQFGIFVFEVQEFDTREPANSANLRQSGVVEWESEQLASDRVNKTTDWRSHVPLDPQPGDVFEELATLQPTLDDLHNIYLEQLAANLIPNVLQDLVIPLGTSLPPAPTE